MKAKKSLGQHFLMHPRIAERIADTAKLTKDDVVFEIGPGTGVLTRALLARAKKVIAVEADAELYAKLAADFAPEIARGRLILTKEDIRATNIGTLLKDYVVVANIPYYLTGEILRLFLEAPNQPRTMTLMVQKEVAERIARSKKESVLSLSVKAYGTPKYEFTVPRGAFVPAPKVNSAVLSVRDISRKHFATATEEKRFFELIHAGFAHKRKKLANNLQEIDVAVPLALTTTRAEDLSLALWLALIKKGG
ncbi:ribosomal RNA small subunit methyltransferase A [Candidatus Kaiserbacteria bacterium RIFCSPLOWO2_02_FULL_56_11]|uniref:Ribosomal RNA small subunit methyltransferase A n=2 Tax=Candidatus Kaiseribacteriota TaxID=1752734 RepID=A0A1F6E1W7_9BACT|nr:MAG: ribosomal RNA small subunit methyltransferase A [Candidatus Kaiserbacteria bacterium RIFCSPHIGHO2_02_FULL_56_30]OGG72361.1 MAG: ribosomal RNA small subunit methyltransferase A [Candidatus Kaiserbacteria bacterium RIFCSPHIGHO2_12_FULL_56_13]OGG80834.1 MAG: ribosomal RNA small subunit methyltransferase A [Candidatus Kaiserbacteria bacterium RIFCSPLOWO2_02_FULL_56_11]